MTRHPRVSLLYWEKQYFLFKTLKIIAMCERVPNIPRNPFVWYFFLKTPKLF